MKYTGKNFLDNLSLGITDMLRGLVQNLFGPGADRIAFGNVSWADLGATLCFVLLAVLLNLAVAGYFRLKIRQSDKSKNKDLLHRVIGALGKPVYLLIWVYGIYFATIPLLLRLPADRGFATLLGIFDQLFDLGVFAVIFWLFFRFTHVIEARLLIWANKTDSQLDNLFVPLLGNSLRIIVPVVGIIFALPMLNLPPEYSGILGRGTSILLIVAVALIAFRAVSVGEESVLTKFDIKAADNLQARKIYTQVHVISKVAYAVITVFTIASVLMLFEEVRSYGKNILASAGVVGIIIGFAAQKTISNLFAGFQIAMTQPIRLDDVVIVEGEWGRVEEISLTYVVIRIWDERRLVVPLGYFIEKPFQNWTRTSADLLGSVFVWVDYTLPLDEIRKALKEIIEPHPLWDKRFWNLQVTDATEKTMQIRVLATTADSGKGWDLRCDIREKLIAYIQKNHPNCLPRFRAELDGEKAGLLAKP